MDNNIYYENQELMTIEYYLSRFKNVLLIRRLQQNTIVCYLEVLKTFLKFCFDNGIIPEDLSDEALEQWLAQTKSESLLRQRIGTIQNFYQSVLGKPYALAHLRYPKRHHYKPDYLTFIETLAIIDSIKNKKQKALVACQYYLALRVFEVCKIKVSDFTKNYDSRFGGFIWDIKVMGKGGNEDILPVPNELIPFVEDYYSSLDDLPSDFLFPGQFKESYATGTVRVIMKRQMKMLGIKKKGATHILRHSRITHLLQSGASAIHVQKLSRHKNIKTVLTYEHLDKNDLRVAFSKCDKTLFSQIKEINQKLLNQKSA